MIGHGHGATQTPTHSGLEMVSDKIVCECCISHVFRNEDCAEGVVLCAP